MVFFVESSEKIPPCPCCSGILNYRDSRLRIRKHEGGTHDYIKIKRYRCSSCKKYHNELPDALLPYKHYEAELICGVLDEIITPETLEEDYPSISTMLCWLRWFQQNIENIEGYLRNVSYTILKLDQEILYSDQSLLKEVRNTHQDWLEKVIRIIYNSGGFLPALY